MTRDVRVADYVFSFVAEQGVTTVFLVPGGGSMYLVDALAQSPDLTFVPNHHEQASAIAAEAYARISGGIGVVLLTTGPGATNAITGVAGAWLESTPLLVISGQVKRADRAGVSGLRQRGPQEIDIVPIVSSFTKYAVTIMDPLDIRFHLEKAAYLAKRGRGGPVWIDIPLDVQAAPIDPETLRGFTPEVQIVDKGAALVAQARAVIRLVNESKRPLLLAGHGIRLAGAAAAFKELYEKLGVPVATTWTSVDLIPATHPLSVGKPGAVAQRASNFIVQNSDLLITIGARLENSLTAFNANKFGRNALKVIVDVDPAELAKFDMPIEQAIEADAHEFIDAVLSLADELECVDRKAWHAMCSDLMQRYPVNENLQIPVAGAISHYHVTHALSEALPKDALIVTGSSGLAIEFFYAGFQAKSGQRVMHTAGLGAMGYGLPAMVGAGSVRKEPFFGIESDGSLMFNLQELLTIRAMNVPVRLFVLNNHGYASIRNTQRNYFDGRYVGTGPEAKLLIADVLAIAASIGIPAMRISDASTLREGIQFAIDEPGPFICDIELMANEALWPKSAAIPGRDGSMISMPLEDMSPLLPRDELRRNLIGPLESASERAEVSLPTESRSSGRPAAVDD